jgi:hypothetical protein
MGRCHHVQAEINGNFCYTFNQVFAETGNLALVTSSTEPVTTYVSKHIPQGKGGNPDAPREMLRSRYTMGVSVMRRTVSAPSGVDPHRRATIQVDGMKGARRHDCTGSLEEAQAKH